MQVQEINASTGETVLRDMTPEEILAHQELAREELESRQIQEQKVAMRINEQMLLNTLLETFIPYLQQVLGGNPPVMTFDQFMRGVAEGYIRKSQEEAQRQPPPKKKLKI
jgi:hypothetical protein